MKTCKWAVRSSWHAIRNNKSFLSLLFTRLAVQCTQCTCLFKEEVSCIVLHVLVVQVAHSTRGKLHTLHLNLRQEKQWPEKRKKLNRVQPKEGQSETMCKTQILNNAKQWEKEGEAHPTQGRAETQPRNVRNFLRLAASHFSHPSFFEVVPMIDSFSGKMYFFWLDYNIS